MSFAERRVGISRGRTSYELQDVRDRLRDVLALIGCDWKSIAGPGDRVVLKPNLVRECHVSRPEEWEQIITNGTIVQAVAEEVAAAMSGVGTLTIADSPQTDSNFDAISNRLGLDEFAVLLSQRYPRLTLRIVDLRREAWVTRGSVVVQRRRLPDAPEGYTCVDLASNSCFRDKPGPFYGADYDTQFTDAHHSSGHHRYLLARLALDADVFINLPKLKTHKKVGVTLSLKNLVGINGDKNYLPHFTQGTPGVQGDEFASDELKNRVQGQGLRAFRTFMRGASPIARVLGPALRSAGRGVFGDTSTVVRSGNWHGNDTAWRMVLDLNRILFHFDGSAAIRQRPLRYLSIVDGIVGGDGNGPLEADAVASGVLIAGRNPVAVDLVCCTLMGFDWRRVPTIREAFELQELRLTDFGPDDIQIRPQVGAPLKFRPHFGWVGALGD